MPTSIGASLARVQALSVALFLVASIIAIGAVQMLSRSETVLYAQDMSRLMKVEDIADTLAENRIAEAYLIFSDTADNRRLLTKRQHELRAELQDLKGLMHSSPREADAIRLGAVWGGYVAEQGKLTDLVQSARTAEALLLFKGPLEDRFQAVDRMTDALIARISDDVKGASERARLLGRIAMGLVALVCGLGMLLALAMLRFVQRQVVRPLATITRSLSELAAGNLDVALSGADRRDEMGAMVRALKVFRNQSLQLEEAHRATLQAQAHAESLARHDVLTGLPNRRLFIEAVTRATELEGEPPFALLLIDLDRFKPINDVYGHDAGDAVLLALAQRFTARRHEFGTVARLGGDEFVVLAPIVEGMTDITRAARVLIRIISEPIAVDGALLEVGATIGVALFPQDGRRPSELLRAADLAMYQAKTEERGTYRFFETAMHAEVEQRAFFDADLRRGITQGEIHPYYQPLVTIHGGELAGFEILSRWHHPQRGLVMPDDFIPAADERGLLTDLTYRILRQACKDARDWPQHLRLSINLSPSQLLDPLLAPRMLAILTEGGIAPGRIEVEVTEGALISDLEATRAVLSSLQNLGMTVALDDFGTGYSSLYHLREMKFDKIKVDKSFVMALDAGEENEKIVRAMISLSKSLGLTTTAEGIEDAEQWALLSSWGCDFGQGYLFGKAMPADQALALANELKPQAGESLPGRRGKGRRQSARRQA